MFLSISGVWLRSIFCQAPSFAADLPCLHILKGENSSKRSTLDFPSGEQMFAEEYRVSIPCAIQNKTHGFNRKRLIFNQTWLVHTAFYIPQYTLRRKIPNTIGHCSWTFCSNRKPERWNEHHPPFKSEVFWLVNEILTKEDQWFQQTFWLGFGLWHGDLKHMVIVWLLKQFTSNLDCCLHRFPTWPNSPQKAGDEKIVMGIRQKLFDKLNSQVRTTSAVPFSWATTRYMSEYTCDTS